jgi:hypothetical protein
VATVPIHNPNWAVLAAAIIAIGIIILCPGAIRVAKASAGCTAVNSGGFNVTNSNGGNETKTISGFNVGDNVTFLVDAVGLPSETWILDSGNNTQLASDIDAGAETFTYTVSGNNSDTTLISHAISSSALGMVTVSATCTAAASGSSTNTDSQKLQSLVSVGTQIIGNVSGQVVSNAVGGAINDAFASGGSFFTGGGNGFHLSFAGDPAAEQAPRDQRIEEAYASLGYAAGMPAKAAPPPAAPIWLSWLDVRGTGFDRDDAAVGMQDRQVNATAGIGRLLSADLLVGVFTGYENYRLTVASLTGTMAGNGGTIGSYAAWRLAPNWRVNGMFGWTGLSDSATAGTASGSFKGSRWLASGGFTGNYRAGTLVFEPSSNVYALWEHDGSFTDSLGTLQPANNFSAGRIATGGKLSDPLPWSGNFTVSPYVGLYADWYWGTSTALPGGAPLVGFGDGWSGRVAGGVAVARAAGGTLSLGGEYGGLGAAYKIWTASGRVEWPF